MEVKSDFAPSAPAASHAVDEHHVGAVEYTETSGVGAPLPKLIEVEVGMLAQPCRAQCGHAEVGDAQPEAVLARRAPLEIAEREQRDHVAVRGRAGHAELIGDVRDPEHGALGCEATQDRETALERL